MQLIEYKLTGMEYGLIVVVNRNQSLTGRKEYKAEPVIDQIITTDTQTLLSTLILIVNHSPIQHRTKHSIKVEIKSMLRKRLFQQRR